MKLRRVTATVAATLLASLAIASTATAQEPAWAPADQADIRPGSMTFTDGAQCTSNFVFYDASSIYIGQAAHCSGTEDSTATNGCDSNSLPEGTEVEVEGASQPATMVYNSWRTMQAQRETDENACDFNDFALLQLDPADHDEVNPTIPFFGGPTGMTDTTTQGETVYSYGNSSLRGGIDALKPKEGKSLGQTGGGWNHQVYTFTPGIPGDSGSAFINAQGQAFGVLSTVQIAPFAGSNGVGDVSRELAYMEGNSAFDVTLAQGTEPFTGGRLFR